MTQTAMSLNTDAKTAIAEALNQSVAETAVTTMLAQNFHWNVTGMGFGPLHDLFQKIYEDHFVAQDDLAERIKAIDAHAEGTLAGMIKRSKIAEHDGDAPHIVLLSSHMRMRFIARSTQVQIGNLCGRKNAESVITFWT